RSYGDWSSDVYSSDLLLRGRVGRGQKALHGRRREDLVLIAGVMIARGARGSGELRQHLGPRLRAGLARRKAVGIRLANDRVVVRSEERRVVRSVGYGG